jgi:hypothetical protein
MHTARKYTENNGRNTYLGLHILWSLNIFFVIEEINWIKNRLNAF